MISNCKFLTVYHKEITNNHLTKWNKTVYRDVWFFKNNNSNIKFGIEDTNLVSIRIPYNVNPNINLSNIEIGDIVVNAKVNKEINDIQDLSNYKTFTITSINNNDFGTARHIHIEGK